MAIQFIREPKEKEKNMFKLLDRTWLSADGTRLATTADAQKSLLGNAGDFISSGRARALGLLVDAPTAPTRKESAPAEDKEILPASTKRKRK